MTIPKGIDYGFTITVIEKDSFLPQDLQNMDLVNSSFKLCRLDTLCNVVTGTATMTRLADEVTIYDETADTITRNYSTGEAVHQTTSGVYYLCSNDVASEKTLSDTDYFNKVTAFRATESTDTLTQNYYLGDLVHQTTTDVWYKTLSDIAYTKSLTDSNYFDTVNAYSESSTTITDNCLVDEIIKNTGTGLWYRCIQNAEVIRLTNTGYFQQVTPYEETSATTTVDYPVNSYVKDISSGIWYRCILSSTTGALLTNLTYFEVVTLNSEASLITTSGYTVNNLVYSSLYNLYYRCIFSVDASPLLTDVGYFTVFTLNAETSNTITNDYVIDDIIYNSTSNIYFRCISAATTTELLTDTGNFGVITVITEASDTIANDYTVGEYGYDSLIDSMYIAKTTVTANELLTDVDYFDVVLLADLTTYLDGKIKVVLDSTMTASLVESRGDAVDGYYLKPTYQGVINIKFTDDTPERTAIIEKVYVAPTGVECA